MITFEIDEKGCTHHVALCHMFIK